MPRRALVGSREELHAWFEGTGASASRGAERRRLFDLGILPGTKITAEFESPSGNPAAYKVRGAVIALRENQAQHIKVKRLEVEA